MKNKISLRVEKCFYDYWENCLFICTDDQGRIVEIHDTKTNQTWKRMIYFEGDEEQFTEIFTCYKNFDVIEELKNTFLKK